MYKNIPPVTRNLLIINFIVYLAQIAFAGHNTDLADVFGLHFILASDFRIYQLFTYMFLHGGFTHLFFNMFSLWMFARIIEQEFGSKKFLILYIVSGVGAGFCQECWQLGQYYIEGWGNYAVVNTGGSVMPMANYLNMMTTVGASGAVYGILLAFGMQHPNDTIMLIFPPIPLKAKYMIGGFIVIEVLSSFSSNTNVAHFAHLGGMLFAWLLILYWRKKYRTHTSSFRGWNTWTPESENTNILQRIRNLFKPKEKPTYKQNTTTHSADYNYNAHKRENEKRIDEILDKVKKSGYQSLTEDEKKELFRRSR